MTRSLSFCHGLFLVPCGMRNGRGSEPVQAVLQEAGQAGSKYGHAVGSLAPELQAPHRKQPTRPVQAHKLPVRERAWACPGLEVQLGRSKMRARFWFLHCKGTAGCWHLSAPRKWRAPQMASCPVCLQALRGTDCSDFKRPKK